MDNLLFQTGNRGIPDSKIACFGLLGVLILAQRSPEFEADLDFEIYRYEWIFQV